MPYCTCGLSRNTSVPHGSLAARAVTSWAQDLGVPHPTPLLCALRPQGGKVASVSVSHHLPVDPEGPESWCLGPSMCPKQPQVTSWSSVPTWSRLGHISP